MRSYRPRGLVVAASLSFSLAPLPIHGGSDPVTTAFTYQGTLLDDGAVPTGSYDFLAGLYDSPTSLVPVTLALVFEDVAVAEGLFQLELDFGYQFYGERRWLEIGVRDGGSTGDFEPLLPRQELTATPNAQFATTSLWFHLLGKPEGFDDDVDDDLLDALPCAVGEVPILTESGWDCATYAGGGGGGWQLTGNAGTIPGSHFLGTTDEAPMELRASGERALFLQLAFAGPAGSFNILAGASASDPGLQGVTIAGGGTFEVRNLARSNFGTIGGGGSNEVGIAGEPYLGAAATIAGGWDNEADAACAAIGGGSLNRAGGNGAAVGGGMENQALGAAAVVGGGLENAAHGAYSTIGGGGTASWAIGNLVWSDYGTIGGGGSNEVGVEGGEAGENAFATIGGGRRNRADSLGATIGGGELNWVNGEYGTVGGGGPIPDEPFPSGNTVYDDYGSILGGSGNRVSGSFSSILGGRLNDTGTDYSTIAGGQNNVAGDLFWTGTEPTHAAVGGGQGNRAFGGHGTVGGGQNNHCDGDWCTIGGGGNNEASGLMSSIAGGSNHVCHGENCAIGGGSQNEAAGDHAGVASGGANRALGDFAFVAGGSLNTASGTPSLVAGGSRNVASGDYAAVGGGSENQATGSYAVVAGGELSVAGGLRAAVSGGENNLASGDASAIPGGTNNIAGCLNCFAAGSYAHAIHQGSFVWAEHTSATHVPSPAEYTFSVQASGGVWLGTDRSPSIPVGVFLNTSTGGYLSSTGAWTNSSDRNRKEGFAAVDGAALLAKVRALPVTTWSYIGDPTGARHLGPMAQDFHAAFGLGQDEVSIATVDTAGVALAAIQELARRTDELERALAAIAALERRLAALEARGGAR